MLAFVLGILLAAAPADSADNLDACLEKAPIESPPPITWGEGIQQMWTGDPPVSLDTVRRSLSQVREAHQCLRSLDPRAVERPYLGNIMRTFHEETALLAALRRFSEAFEVFQEARAYLASGPQVPSTEAGRTWWPHILHRNQGLLHYLLGDLSSAIGHYLKALRNTPESDAEQRVTYLVDIGVVHQRTQDYRSARRYFDRAESLFRESPLSPATHAPTWTRLLWVKADLLLEKTLNTEFDRNLLTQARTLAARARSTAQPNTKRYAWISLVLSESQGYLGNFEAAYRLNKAARTYARSNESTKLHTFALLKLGILHLQTQRWAQADETLSTALARARALHDLDYQRRILRALGRLHELQNHWPEAEHYYRKGIAVIEDYRESLTASQWSTTAFAQWRDVHRGLVRTLLAQQNNRAALAALDRSRARHLQNLRAQARIANRLPAPKRARFDSLTRALTHVRNRLAQAPSSPERKAALHDREAALMAARQQIVRLDSTNTRPEVSEIQAVLADQDRVLVSYFLDNPWSVYERSPRSAAFVLTGDTLRAISLPRLTQDSIRAQLETTSNVFTGRGPSSRANAMHFDLRPLYTLQEALYAPVAPHVPEGAPLTVVPSGPLFRVPFSMLVRSMPGGRYTPSEARFLLHERPVTVELASSLLADSARSARLRGASAQAELAAFGVSEFDTLRSVPSALRASASLPLSDSTFSLPDLPGVRKEVRAVRRHVGDVKVFMDEAATEAAFQDASRTADVLHLASHAFVHPSSPLQNAFILRPDSTRRPTDGVLFLHELQTRTRPVSFVVLSGCDTGRGSYRGGEGMEGLQYAFRAMGAEATLSSLWPVVDRANVVLIDAFYRHLQEGLRKDEALRQAKLEYLESNPGRASPFFWAPTVLYGSPAPATLKAPAFLPPWAWGLLGLGAAAVVGFLIWRRARSALVRPR